MNTETYDLVVIGSGPAGEKGAAEAAYFGKRVALVEQAEVCGGAGVNTGTLPSKTLRETALYLSGVRDRGLYGVERVLTHELRVDDLLYRLHQVVSAQQARVERNLDHYHITLIRGLGRLVDRDCVEVTLPAGGTRRLKASAILVATGSRPYHPPEVPFDGRHIHDSDTLLSLSFLPRTMIVVGAGVIGSEYASIFAALGVRTTLVDTHEDVLGHVDDEIVGLLKDIFQQRLGMSLRLGHRITSYAIEDNQAIVRLEGGPEGGEELRADVLLFAGGRQGNTDGLGLEELGIEVNRRGQIGVDQWYATAAPGVYAAGDVVGFPALAATAMEQARIAVLHAFGLHELEVDRLASILPYGIYTIPEIGIVGETEESAREKGIVYEVGRAPLAANPRAQILGETEGLVKLLFDPKDRTILGAHVIGERATEIIHVAATCMSLGGTLDYFVQAVFNYPSLSDSFKYAAYDGLARLAGRDASSLE